jgi:hypothetical protein
VARRFIIFTYLILSSDQIKEYELHRTSILLGGKYFRLGGCGCIGRIRSCREIWIKTRKNNLRDIGIDGRKILEVVLEGLVCGQYSSGSELGSSGRFLGTRW